MTLKQKYITTNINTFDLSKRSLNRDVVQGISTLIRYAKGIRLGNQESSMEILPMCLYKKNEKYYIDCLDKNTQKQLELGNKEISEIIDVQNYPNKQKYILDEECEIHTINWSFYAELYGINSPIRIFRNKIEKMIIGIAKDYCIKDSIILEINQCGKQNVPCKIVQETTKNNERYIISFDIMFLELLWIFAYSSIVLFDEAIMKKIMNGTYDGTFKNLNEQAIQAKILLENGIYRILRSDNWNITYLINPEIVSEDYNNYVSVANGLFLSALNVIILHEIGHISLEHFSRNKSKANYFEHRYEEMEADLFAIKEHLRNKKGKLLKTNQLGAILAYSALLMISTNEHSISHPDYDERILLVHENLKLNKLNVYWGYTSLFIRFWDTYQRRQFNWLHGLDNYKQQFYSLIKQMRRRKRMIKNSRELVSVYLSNIYIKLRRADIWLLNRMLLPISCLISIVLKIFYKKLRYYKFYD